MARVTVEDCLSGQVDNRFELVLVAAKRARQLAKGFADPMIDWDNDKPTVVALREIADGHIGRDYLLKKDHEFATNPLDLMLSETNF